jgi:hypothetical protein
LRMAIPMSTVTTKIEPRPRVQKSLSVPSPAAGVPAEEAGQPPIKTPVESTLPLKPPVVLGIGLPRSLAYSGIEIRRPATERAVIELLRQTEFDLLLVSAKPEEEKVWNLMRLIRRHWPGLRWVLFSDDCTDAQEIQARSLGAVCVTADQQTIEELAFG